MSDSPLTPLIFPVGAVPRTARTGDKPKPSAIKAAEGNRGGKRRIDPLEPKPDEDQVVPPPPEHLDELAARIWTYELAPLVVRMRVLTVADRVALSILCQLEARRRMLEDDIQENGRYVEVLSTAGDLVEKSRPQVGELERLIPQVWAGLREFGLTPSSRPKVQMVPGGGASSKKENDGNDYFG